jgi:hypothetical protein
MSVMSERTLRIYGLSVTAATAGAEETAAAVIAELPDGDTP